MEMRIPASWVIAGALAIGLTSCAGEETATTPSPSASPSASGSSSPSPSASPTAQSFSQPLVSEKDKAAGKGEGDKNNKDKKVAAKSLNTISGLTRSTDPAEQAKKVQAQIDAGKANRTDPFRSLPPIVTFTAPKVPSSMPDKTDGTPIGGGGSPGVRGGGSPGVRGRGMGTGNGQEAPKAANMPELPKFPEISRPSPKPIARRPEQRPFNPGRPVNPSGPSAGPKIPVAPPIPQPTLAREVEVTGIVTIGNRTQAIIKAPNEPTSRYVSVGDRVSNGQVLIKRIEQIPGRDPVVILEENGMEVEVAVGSKKSSKP